MTKRGIPPRDNGTPTRVYVMLYPAERQRLARLAGRWKCSEAAAVRRALELADANDKDVTRG